MKSNEEKGSCRKHQVYVILSAKKQATSDDLDQL